ncbi:PfkB family carbohydrate kinase [Streptomyces scopuliridis]|uniref:PfkB family carbohydrate kinase n=1 Tax=Streptomyces scopuliridis TaxID=452529 RepID=UPI00367F37EF
MRRLSVVGNISRDRTRYPDRRGGEQLGGAALLLSLASYRAGMEAAPVSVVGHDLRKRVLTSSLDVIDRSALRIVDGPSATFTLDYDGEGRLRAVDARYGVADGGTRHALQHIARYPDDIYHVCGRRPLDLSAVLGALDTVTADFSVDFFLPSAEEKIREAAPLLPRASTIFVNSSEYRLLSRAVSLNDLPEIVVTDGPGPARILHHGKQIASVTPPATASGEVTGAGDTLAGTYLANRARGAEPLRALSEAVAAAASHISSPPPCLPAPLRP